MPKKSLKHILKRAIQKNKCDTFTLQQRGKTCYMAASTLMFGRVVIPYVSNVEDPIKLYVRRSMANLWDDAQGPLSSSCPRIPLRIRQFYTMLRYFENHETYPVLPNLPYVLERKDFSYAEDVYERISMQGGVSHLFFVSMCWASNIPCRLTLQTVDLDAAVDLNDRMYESIHANSFSGGFLVSYFLLSLDGDPGAAVSDGYLEFLLHNLYSRLSKQKVELCGVLMSVSKVVNGNLKSHSVSAYPCLESYVNKHKNKKLRYQWVMCNTNDDVCHSNLRKGLQNLEFQKGYDALDRIAFIVKK